MRVKRPLLPRIQRTLLTGFFVLAPVGVTLLLLSWFVALVDHAVSPLVALIGRPLPGIGLILALALVWVAGTLASNLAGRHLLEAAEDFLLRIPVFNWLYKTVKQVSEIFSPSHRWGLGGAVLVEYPRPGVYSLGFVTKEVALQAPGQGREDLLCVYIPTNHVYIGDIVFVPAGRVRAVDISQQQAFQAALSAGASLPEIIRSLGQGARPEAETFMETDKTEGAEP